jgi:hypothetical protein
LPRIPQAITAEFVEHLDEGNCRQCRAFFLQLDKEQQMMQLLRDSKNLESMDKHQQQLVANSVPEFLALAGKFTDQWFQKEKNWGPWFRGHGDARWELMPKLYREKPPNRGRRIVEDELRQDFMMRAPRLSNERPQNSWEWYFLMQHSGAPTRLLDWTESALIALYFAVRDKKDDADAAVWV